MRENCTSGSMRGSVGKGVVCNSRPPLSTLQLIRGSWAYVSGVVTRHIAYNFFVLHPYNLCTQSKTSPATTANA